MKAIDTNVLARLVLADDDVQYRVATALLDEPLWVTVTVWLELGWVLRTRLKLEREAVGNALIALLTTDAIHTADHDGIRWAIDRYRAGADWADMIHLVSARGAADTFLTFDRAVARQCGDASPMSVEILA